MPTWALQWGGGILAGVVAWLLQRSIAQIDRRQDACDDSGRKHADRLTVLEREVAVLASKVVDPRK